MFVNPKKRRDAVKKLLIPPMVLAVLIGLVMGFSTTAVAAEPTVVYDVCPEAKITKFEYPIDKKCKIAKQPCVTFVMTLMNVSDKPLRFDARIVMPKEGKGVGGFIPRKGKKDKATGKSKPPVVDPGKSVTVKYPALQFEMPERIEVSVSAMK